ncbi:SEFIR domain-containing protein [Caulobacter sp. NIBR1757]|uniref:SEFIR domain-containing protein n=1 Tax=Caulobacter sp. NIBR1757 TaxID=3016000 RepID=UPI0022F01C5D|nr:SEFIR domain-containing protein [Caulobacter sp. NIBR1757]WGM40424.1 hypothetical protein AMEJIAPC_03369 [Caulobacter sp. NIBR1757]
MEPVKAFISYAWTSPVHEDWVLQLATRLRQDGVDIIMDKWDLKPGHDSVKFMEQMVTDEGVTKVIMICDHKYSQKADNREGGVGTEAQIISPELYGKSMQDKYVAVVSELDEAGKPYLPVYYRGRIYFDLSSDTRFEDEYDKLLRWIVGKPVHVKPEIGAPPHYLDENSVKLETESAFRRAENLLRSGASTALSAVRDYADVFVREYAKLAIVQRPGVEIDDLIVEAIQAATPYIRQIEELAIAAARSPQKENFLEVVALLERIGRFMYPAPEVTSWRTADYDAFKFNAHLLLVSVVAVSVQEGRFDLTEAIVNYPFMLNIGPSSEGRIEGYEGFRNYLASLNEYRNQRLGLRRMSVQADLMKEHYSAHNISFDRAMEADFLLYIKSSINDESGRSSWYPVTSVWAERRFRPFEIFARAESMRFATSILPIFGVGAVANLKDKLVAIGNDRQRFRSGEFGISLAVLTNAEHIGARP